MNILAIESSGAVASAAVTKDGVLLAQSSVNNKTTHSQTLLPMIEDVMTKGGLQMKDIDHIAVSTGPGSYTGLRIGVSTAKGLSLGGGVPDAGLEGIPCIPVSSLEALAFNLCECEGVYICPVMDARRDRVYCALYWFWADDEGNYHAESSIPDTVLETDKLLDRLENTRRGIVFVGDGTELIKKKIAGRNIKFAFASKNNNYPSALSVAEAARVKTESGEVISADDLEPEYLTDSQAERSRFREMKEADAERVAEIEKVSISPPWSEESLKNAILKEETFYAVCESGGKIKAYAGMWLAADEAEITAVAVEPESRGAGLGTDMVNYMIAQGRDKGVKSFFLEVRKSNTAAIALYKKCGFEEAGIRKDFYRTPTEDGIVMTKTL